MDEILNDPLSHDVLETLFQVSPSDSTRINRRESHTVEFKESYNHSGMAQYFKTMAAFANNVGGYLIFGIGDRPRKLLGLKEKSLAQFEELKVEDLTRNLLDYFSPEIKWNHCTYEFNDMKFGIIYVYQLRRKPCICKKHYEIQSLKYTLQEGDIYYRYGGRSERIRYAELADIVDSSRKEEEQRWIEFAKRAAKVGIDNIALLDLDKGEITGQGGSLLVDEKLISKLSFIKEGEFVETKGKPALRLIGDVQRIETGRLIVKETTKQIPKAIDPNDIIKAFLNNYDLSEPLEYFKAICSSNTANLPMYYLLAQAKKSIPDAITIIERKTSRGPAKKKLLERLQGKMVVQSIISEKTTHASLNKRQFRKMWMDENVIVDRTGLCYCFDALSSLNDDEIKDHKEYIKSKLLELFDEHYEKMDSNLASNMRKTICRIDEVLFSEEVSNRSSGLSSM